MTIIAQSQSQIFKIANQSWNRRGASASIAWLRAGMGYLITAACIYLATRGVDIPLVITWFAAAVFFQFACGAQEFAILQRILPRSAISNGTGLYNGIAVLGGGLLSSEGIGRLVEYTESYTIGLFSVVIGAMAAGLALLCLARSLKY